MPTHETSGNSMNMKDQILQIRRNDPIVDTVLRIHKYLPWSQQLEHLVVALVEVNAVLAAELIKARTNAPMPAIPAFINASLDVGGGEGCKVTTETRR